MTKQTVFGEKALETNGGQEEEEEKKRKKKKEKKKKSEPVSLGPVTALLGEIALLYFGPLRLTVDRLHPRKAK